VIASRLVTLLAAAPPADSGGPQEAAPLTGWERLAEDILFTASSVGVVVLFLGFLLCLYRIIRGPTLVDRGLGSDTLALQVVGIAILITITARTLYFFDAALIVAILGFATTVAFAQFIARRGAV
jgi:multisubunit Na+/H+ antiporter MnhF subunit